MRGVTLPARGWIACQKSVTDAGSIMVPVVRVVVPISERPNGLKAGHGKPKRFPTGKTSRLPCGRSHVNVLICQAERIKGAVRLLSRLRVRCFRFSLLYFYKAECSPLDN